MDFWSYCAPLHELISFVDFCTVYFMVLLGRCAIISFPLLGIVLLMRRTVLKNSIFAKGAIWAVFLPVLFLGKLSVYYEFQYRFIFLPMICWQSFCSGYWFVCYGYLLGIVINLVLLIRRRRKLHRMINTLPSTEIEGQRVYICDAAISPFTTGVLSPKIVLPKTVWQQFDKDELKAVIMHEQTHIRLKHLWCFLLWDVLCALFWINPFLRLSSPKMKEDMEYICDRVTIRKSGRDPVYYGKMILKSVLLLKDENSKMAASFAGESDFTDLKRRLCLVRDYHPYSRGNAAAFCVCAAGIMLAIIIAISFISLPQYTELNGFSIVHISDDIEFSTVYESDKDDSPPLRLNGDSAILDNKAFLSLLPEDAPKDGIYYILWGGFMKVPGIGGAQNAVWLEGISDGEETYADFQDVNEDLFVKLAKII